MACQRSALTGGRLHPGWNHTHLSCGGMVLGKRGEDVGGKLFQVGRGTPCAPVWNDNERRARSDTPYHGTIKPSPMETGNFDRGGSTEKTVL